MEKRREVAKCVAWNAARYEKEYNYDLAVKLLLEETDELFSAPSVVDILDAVGDMAFVAIGVMWKLGLEVETIESIFYDNDLSQASSEELYNHCSYVHNLYLTNFMDGEWVDEEAQTKMPGLNLACFTVFVTAISALRGLGMQGSFYDILDAICDSNDTKEVKGRTDPAVKANVVKGTGYVPPTTRLQQIEFLYNAREKMTS